MESSLILRVVGGAFIAFGILLSFNPELISSKPVPADPFEAIERRIWWGLFIGGGCLLMFHHQLVPWQPTVAAAGFSLVFGFLVARLIGIVLDGSVSKRWLYVGIELLIMVPFGWWYLKTRS